MASSDAVFEGTVIEVRGPKGDSGHGNVEVDFRVGRRFKAAGGETVTVVTASSSAACGYNFEQNGTYLVYARNGEDDRLGVSLCSRTARIEDATEDLAALGGAANPGPGPTPAPEDPASPPPPATEPGKRGCGGCSTGTPVDGMAGLLLVMAAALAMRRRA